MILRQRVLKTSPKENALPSYKHTVLKVCELQLKLCKKIIQISSKKSHEPEPLKEIAGGTILKPLMKTRSTQKARVAIENLRRWLPSDLVNFLHYKSDRIVQ
ncbi:unnamed protein product [Bursaphelenchus okinawaensis]|uniref:Uncharacterized protein n=1 Tax=Bursaphelenchus okinawaensis TaxID=465554 RepID=A0A811LMZ9_9BILA|nr:unnamed protein product [Bursaphelenchus okinawaensis]CAG9126727.1 unnamed protein product [Bursaphelenchus okinawaensis]